MKIEKILRAITPKTVKTKKIKGENSQDYSQYLVMEIMNRAMTNIMENSGKKARLNLSDIDDLETKMTITDLRM